MNSKRRCYDFSLIKNTFLFNLVNKGGLKNEIWKENFLGMLLLFPLSCHVAIAQEEVVLKIWDTAAPLRDPFREIVFEKFGSENPGVKVEYEGIPGHSIWKKLLRQLLLVLPLM